VTVIDARNFRVVGTTALDGKPEFPVSDGQGFVYVNIEDKSEIAKIDPNDLSVKARWPLSPCESPSGMAIDRQRHRLFSVCDNKMMAVVDYRTGQLLATPAIGEGPDAAAFDPGRRLVFSSNGEDGTLTVIREGGIGMSTMFRENRGNKPFQVMATVKTARGARTMALDPDTHKIYLSSATLGPAPTATSSKPHTRPAIVPGSFKVLIVSQ
jgi:DNA-binding beta-propeller fold protein YncE